MSSNFRILIVDDEAPARRRLRDFLETNSRFEVIGECGDGLSAASTILDSSPDIVLLDVQMPGCDGFGVIEKVGAEDMPVVIFVTAYDEYAVRAFEVHALDYVEKPWSPERLGDALERACEEVGRKREGNHSRRLLTLLESRAHPDAPCPRLIVRSGTRAVFLELDEILRVEAASNYLRIHTLEAEYLARESLTALEARLPADRFLRLHRSHLVRIEAIREVGPDEDGELSVLLRGGKRLRVGRAYKEVVQQLLRE